MRLLGELILDAATRSQLLVTTHAEPLVHAWPQPRTPRSSSSSATPPRR
jgi:predicted ATPase